MQPHFNKYINNNFVVFSVNIRQKQHKNGNYKKDLVYPKDWESFTLQQTFFNPNYNSLSLLTGKINNIIVIDIDNIEHWTKLLDKNKNIEPKTVKAISGSGGVHLYFKYSEDLENIKTTSKCFGQEYDIDIRTNGGNIIIPPTKYYNNNFNKEVIYTWENSIFDNEIIELPSWIKNLLIKKNTNIKLKKSNDIIAISNSNDNYYEEINDFEIINEDQNLFFSINEIEMLLDMISINRCDNYTDWINVGLCLHNINNKYLLLWEKWSQYSNKYKDGECEKIWNKFKKNKDGLKIGSIIFTL